MRFKLEALAGLLLFSSVLMADPVTSVSCDVGLVSVSDPINCSLGTLQVGAVPGGAESNASYSFPVSSGAYFATSVKSSATAAGLEATTSSATAEISSGLQTMGPERAGYLDVEFPEIQVALEGEDYIGTISLTLGSFAIHCGGVNQASPCEATDGGMLIRVPGGNPPYVVSGDSVMVPFILGEPFSFDLSSLSSVFSGPPEGTSEAYTSADVQFRFLEADGVTPVQLVPEPAEWLLVTLGICGCWQWRRRNVDVR